jgi:DNA-binding HxlR family transcriptional regulator
MTDDTTTLMLLKKLVEAAKPFLKVEQKTGSVLISQEFNFANSDKIFLLLLGKYFAMNYGVLKDHAITLGDISSELGIKRTTLPSPLKTLMDNGVVERPKENTYRLNPYKADYVLRKLNEKFTVGKEK